jgi:hypothetical protein
VAKKNPIESHPLLDETGTPLPIPAACVRGLLPESPPVKLSAFAVLTLTINAINF